MEKIKEKLAIPTVQIIIFALIILAGISLIMLTVKNDNERNTPDMRDPRASAVVTGVTVMSSENAEYYNVIVDFEGTDGNSYRNIAIYNIPFKVAVGDSINIKYDAAQPSICSVVDDPVVSYSITAYVFLSAVVLMGILGFCAAVRRSHLKEISDNVSKRNATREEIDKVKEGYGSYDGTGKPNPDAAPFSDKIDYNKIYDENRGVMDSYFDPTALYSGYSEDDGSEDNNF